MYDFDCQRGSVGNLCIMDGAMTTLAELTLKVARLITPDNITDGEATGGTATTLIDTNFLTQEANYWNAGILWIRSGTHAGKVATPVTFDSTTDTLTFSSLGSAVASGVKYAVARNIYPYHVIRAGINEALEETWVEGDDTSLTGDGETLEFTLPSGVSHVIRVHLESPTHTNYKPVSTHWREQAGKL